MKRGTTRFVVFVICMFIISGYTIANGRAYSDAEQSLELEAGLLADLDSYGNKVQTLFAKGYERDVIFRMVCIPSFIPEWLVGIRKTGDKYSAFVLRPEQPIWNAELITMYESGQIKEIVKDEKGNVVSRIATNAISRLKSEVPQDYRQIRVNEKSEVIDAETAKSLADLWSIMLLSAQHPKQSNAGCDGVTYYFSMWLPGHRIASGKIWSPSPETRAGLLSSLGELVAAYVDAPSEKKQEALGKIKLVAKILRLKLSRLPTTGGTGRR